MQAQELRGGASPILAALGAKGVTVLEGYSFVQRGYEHICQDLNALGAAVKKDTGITIYEITENEVDL